MKDNREFKRMLRLLSTIVCIIFVIMPINNKVKTKGFGIILFLTSYIAATNRNRVVIEKIKKVKLKVIFKIIYRVFIKRIKYCLCKLISLILQQ